MAHPTATAGLAGPFTHWYPNGIVESHGEYVGDGAASVPDGVWAFWYEDGSRKLVGRYSHGRPTGCFASWDEHGNQTIGIAEGDHLRPETCHPPVEQMPSIERRSQRGTGWGDLSLDGLAQAGSFGLHNPTQLEPDPAARGTVRGTLRKALGRLRVGPTLGLRFSDTDATTAYVAGVAAGMGFPLRPRLAADVEARASIEYLRIDARRMDVPGVGKTGVWTPLGGLRGGLSFAITPSLGVVAGASIDGAPHHDATEEVRYCAPLCRPVDETWKLGGLSYGVDLGIRVQLR